MELRAVILLILTSVLHPSFADEFPDDDLEERIEAVSDGELRFLPEPPAKPVHHHSNQIYISEESLTSGWVMLNHCHFLLDPVAAVQIVFHADNIRNIDITESLGIDRSWVEENRVELEGVGKDAKLCLSTHSKALHISEKGYELKNGPYMRRFFDGYYPMQISIEISHPKSLLLVETQPMAQTGFKISNSGTVIKANGWFEGKLYTRFRFSKP